MSSIPVALQLYSVRNECASNFLDTIRKVADMGYDGVEFAGFHGHSAEDIKAVLEETGLQVEGAHVPLNAFNEDVFDETIAYYNTIGCKWLIVPWIPESMHNSVESATETAKLFSGLAAKLEPLGLRTGFHAHSGDMRILENGKSAWDIIAANTPDSFLMQYDTANGMEGGADPVQPILDWPGRSASTHLKEWAGEHGAALIGEGDIPWERVFEACEGTGGVQWYVVEHEDETLMPPIAAIEKCLANLRAMGH